MAFNLSDRFLPRAKNYRLLEPAAYQYNDPFKIKPNKAPFLSNTERVTYAGARIWTHSIYHADQHPKIINCTSLMSKRPRFPYEALSAKDLETILCRCELQNVCECTEGNKPEPNISCHANKRRRLFIGHPPISNISEGLAAPSRRDHGFQQMPDGTNKRIFFMKKEGSPPFYDAKIIESTAYYRGCKWSQWQSKRTAKLKEQRPGPADYTIERQLTPDKICYEKVREQKRKHSKQLRFIEMIQQRNLLEGRPGPASYNPQYPKGTNLEHFGPKANRFQSFIEQRPGPSDYWLKRELDPADPPIFPCHARLPESSFFGTKAARFKPRKEEGPGPATYSPSYKMCQNIHCPKTAAFGSSSVRFKDILGDEDDNYDAETIHVPDQDDETHGRCPTLTWEFKSKTIRMKPLEKKLFEQSPADLAMSSFPCKRSKQLQYIAPFYSSEGRFQPWYSWMSVFGKLETPGPGYYNLISTKCQPAVYHGPIYRAERFRIKRYQNPAPNEYNVGRGIETILGTHNKRLNTSIKSKHKFHWKPPLEPKLMTLEERESMLLHKSIALLNVESDTNSKYVGQQLSIKPKTKTKLLRSFLYRNTAKPGF